MPACLPPHLRIMRGSYLSWGVFAIPVFIANVVNGGTIGPVTSTKDQLVASAWYAGWHSDAFPLSAVPWSKYTTVTYSFAITTADGGLSLAGSNPTLLPKFVATARQNNVLPTVSIGGWAGSRYFSSAVATPESRTRFVKTVVNFARQYDLGGLDFDWEYPGRQGIGCNTLSPNDTPNFLAFLQELRQDPLGKTLVLSAAVAITPFTSPSGKPSSDVSGFSHVLDYIAIMNYDIWGPWSATVGPNAPLMDACAAPQNRQGSAVSAITAWISAGFPARQILLGVPSYGHSFTVRRNHAFLPGSTTQLAPYPPFDKNHPPPGDAWDDLAGIDMCGNMNGPGGNFDFWAIIGAKLLNTDGTPKPGVPFRFDTCSQTAYVYNTATEVMISFDNPTAFQAKGKFIKQTGLKGFAMWEAGGDSRTILLDSIRGGAGF